ncbi:exodeoxyribonuclease VII small subunit [Bartonella sp. DGB2]|uniref:exodeoxyribonuclease VII small subunit n=1 Tax=Bartonella sp. DGB2 TaxID=3388426 RepID=UPI0039902145
MDEINNNADVDGLSFEDALKELEGIVGNLERGNISLEDSIRSYERGEALKKRCDTLLKAAEDKVQKIRLSQDGEPEGLEPLDSE